ncbi:MAG: hypothetical protein AB7V56_13025 [Candidatus Nitrosocosmicus sp.]
MDLIDFKKFILEAKFIYRVALIVISSERNPIILIVVCYLVTIIQTYLPLFPNPLHAYTLLEKIDVVNSQITLLGIKI